MKTALFAVLTLIAIPATAQTAANPTPGATTAAPAAAATRLSLDTPIETIAADPAGKAVLTANFPDMLTHPAYDQFKSMTLTQLAPMSQGQITDVALAKAGTELAAIK